MKTVFIILTKHSHNLCYMSVIIIREKFSTKQERLLSYLLNYEDSGLMVLERYTD